MLFLDTVVESSAVSMVPCPQQHARPIQTTRMPCLESACRCQALCAGRAAALPRARASLRSANIQCNKVFTHVASKTSGFSQRFCEPQQQLRHHELTGPAAPTEAALVHALAQEPADSPVLGSGMPAATTTCPKCYTSPAGPENASSTCKRFTAKGSLNVSHAVGSRMRATQ